MPWAYPRGGGRLTRVTAPHWPVLPAGTPVALVTLAAGLALAWPGGACTAEASSPAEAVAAMPDVRWVWWSARESAAALVTAGVHVRSCWDLAAVGALAYGSRRVDPAAVWAAAHDLPEPPQRRGEPELFDLPDAAGELRADGQLAPGWVDGGWAETLASAARWAALAVVVQQRQEAALAAVPDPRAAPGPGRALAVLTAYAESAAALLSVELGHAGLPLDTGIAGGLLSAIVGERPVDAAAETAGRVTRDRRVLDTLPEGTAVDLRSPDQVRALLGRLGIDVPDTRSWRLEPHAATSPTVAALLAWRKSDRVATTYGWLWLDTHVAGGRLRGEWQVADGGAGRMTAGVGLHNMPTELRPAVRAAPGHVFVGADLGQVEPRVLAVVSGDEALGRAAAEQDMYAPVAAQLRCERPAAKVAVLAAMYGQTSGAAGAALRDMDRVYPAAMAYLRGAEAVGRRGGQLRTYGGRLLRFAAGGDEAQTLGRGRYARNAMVQGAAAELFKAWAATVRAGLAGTGGQIVLCLHDELLLHVPAEQATAAATLLEDALAATVHWWAAGSGVRFVADVGTGPSWTDTH
jgi:DNA polymerase-1